MKKLMLSLISLSSVLTCLSDDKINSKEEIQEIRQKMEEHLKDMCISTRTGGKAFNLLRVLNNCARRKSDCDLLKKESTELKNDWQEHVAEFDHLEEFHASIAKDLYSPKDNATKEEQDFAINLNETSVETIIKQETAIFNAVKHFDDLAQQLCTLVEEEQKEKAK